MTIESIDIEPEPVYSGESAQFDIFPIGSSNGSGLISFGRESLRPKSFLSLAILANINCSILFILKVSRASWSHTFTSQ